VAEYLYIHIPFCIRKCTYCDFLSIPLDEDLARDYADALKREIALRGGAELRTVYLGGGTPTVFPEEQLAGIFRALNDHFTVRPDAEITVEANPGTVGREKASFLRTLGVNRMSIGVQSFDDRELALLGRIHTADVARRTVGGLGFENVSLDLMYGIPGQSPESWKDSLRQALALEPTHISAYELTPEPGTPLVDLLKRGEMELPPEDTVIGMGDAALDMLSGAGLRQYEISNHALPGRECRHNLNYWLRGEYLGLGAGAHSFAGDRREKNVWDVREYVAMLATGELPVGESLEVSCEEALREFLFLGLRMTEGVDIARFREDLDLDLMEGAQGLMAEGLMETSGGKLRLTRRGLLLFNPSLVRLMENLGL
jgi:oxygen-independent coproporphyrinogen-3 oxidase